MTWSQMKLFSSASRIAKLADYQMQLSIAHNVYRKDSASLPRAIRQAISAERSGRRAGEGAAISVKHLEAMFGAAKREFVSREELIAKLQPRTKR